MERPAGDKKKPRGGQGYKEGAILVLSIRSYY